MSAATATRPGQASTGKAPAQKERAQEEVSKPTPPPVRKDEQPVAGIEKKKLFVVVNGKKTGDSHLRAAIKHLRCVLQLSGGGLQALPLSQANLLPSCLEDVIRAGLQDLHAA